jgi:hypothetical protein
VSGVASTPHTPDGSVVIVMDSPRRSRDGLPTLGSPLATVVGQGMPPNGAARP